MGRAVFLSAGEVSGDLHGAALARELRRRDPSLRLFGLGGEEMARAGVRLLAGLDRTAVMGLAEVARRLPGLFALRRRVRRFLAEEDVRLFVPIDFPDFNLPLAARARRDGRRVLYAIAPQVWAWRAGRARRLADAADLVCCILPFEEELLARYGVRARFVGHPLLDRADGEGRPGREPAGAVLALFPGSRRQEVERILPPFLGAARRVREARPGVRVLVARAPGLPDRLFPPGTPLASPESTRRRATAALCKSGTATLELALAGVPMVVGYRMSPVTYAVARRVVRVPHVSLVNLVAGRRVVPELLQGAMREDALAERVLPLLDPADPERRRAVQALAEVGRRLGRPGCAARVAEAALELLDGSA